ncbi:MAG: TlpA family protein disulfide reductase [bacterium]|nr:MAG: TlpA family protein disulfide reductase [bacterium]
MRKSDDRSVCLVLSSLVALCAMLIAVGPAGAINVTECDVAPDFAARTLTGRQVTLSHLRGQHVFVAFWSSWCSRCREEMEYLKTLKARYPDVVFLAITSESEDVDGEELARIEQAVQEWDLPFIVILDKGLKIWDSYQVNALPTNVIIGGDGRVIFAEPNFYWASADNIERAMAGRDSSACN